MIVVEGLDNTGKTTLVKRLVKEFPQLHYRASIGNKHDPEWIRTQAEAEAYQYRYNVISDRSRIISEFIYQPILGVRPTAYPLQDWLRYVGQWVNRPQCLIFCDRELENIEAGLADREQLGGVADNLEQLCREYTKKMTFFRWLFELTRGHEYVEYNFDMEADDFKPYDVVKETVEKYLSAQEAA